MATALDLLNAVFLGGFATVGLLLLLASTDRSSAVRAAFGRLGQRLPLATGVWRWDWRWLAGGAAVVYGTVVAFNLAYGLYGCSGTPGSHDLVAYLASGRALLSGGNPFVVNDCGTTIAVPYGFAAIVVNAIGSLGGMAGVAVVWGIVAIVILPLTWWVAGPDRRAATAAVAFSVLFLPLAVNQIDGASNLMVPVAILLALLLARRAGPFAGAVGGFLATGRFPTLFPVLGSTGRFPRPWWSGVATVAAFGAVTGATFFAYGHGYFQTVFVTEVVRRSFSLNFYGILLRNEWLPSSFAVVALQGSLTLALVAAVWWRARSALGAAAITLTGVALLNPFLSFNILGWLLPVALVGLRPRWWLWGVGVVGSANYYVGFLYWGQHLNVWWPSEILDVVMTVLLVGLFIDLWRTEGTGATPAPVVPAEAPTSA